MAYTGGRRLRLIQDNFRSHVYNALAELGWFDSNRAHKPVTLLANPAENDEQIQVNTVAISNHDINSIEAELGSDLEENLMTFWVDVYAENQDIGIHLAGDIRDILRGKMASSGVTLPSFLVYDLTLATPVPLFRCHIEAVDMARVQNSTKAYHKFWWTIVCEVLDVYLDESD
jgi:hypothetical protein